MLSLYLDESGIHDGAPVIVVGGVIGEAAAWDALCADWQVLLDKHQIPFFHATHCYAGEKHFASRGWSEKFLADMVAEFASVIVKHDVQPVCFRIESAVWAAASEEIRDRFAFPYQLLFESALQSASGLSEVKYGGEPVAIVFAEPEKPAAQRAQLFYDVYEQNKGNTNTTNVYSLTFAPAQETKSLQAADVIAHECYRDDARVSGKDHTPAFKVLSQGKPYYGGKITSEKLAMASSAKKEMGGHVKLPVIKKAKSAKKFDDVLKKMLNTAPQPREKAEKKK